ncbi:chondroitin sulfate proteoglycan 4-like [Mytilus californianus]|uniref:chondroitin sulfate proteoglycan 4-like n=1 Tax=Mytilus californianus TaxID=6549 RepID=UPI0022484ECB|nr:chondroitin sulfate proteoglycan 4-like [Mytilus californianus]
MDFQPSLFVLVWFSSVGPVVVNTASFYGDSYINLPFQDDSDTTQLQLRFRTSLPNGLLFLASGTTDYLSVVIKSGKLEVELDLGSGVILLSSVKNTQLNDGNWHRVRFQQKALSFNLIIDDDEIIRTAGTGSLTKLNIQNGIYLGGTPSDISGHGFQNFRGCLQNVLYNQYNVLNLALKLPGESTNHISWNCEEEFGAKKSNEISFSTSISYASFPCLDFRSTGSITLEFKTLQKNALLLLNSANADENTHLIAIEIINKKLKLNVNRGGTTLSISSEVSISDGKWHLIGAGFYDDRFVFGVDVERQQSRYNSGDSRSFRLTSDLFIGGVVGIQEASVIAKNSKLFTSPTSFQGCVRHIVINKEAFGFPDILSSNGLSVGCMSQSPCISNPCESDYRCEETDEGYECVCMSGDCSIVKEEAPERKHTNNDQGDSVVFVTPLSAREGDETIITTSNIDIQFNYRKYNIRESAIQFYVLEKPKFGSFRIDLGRRRNSDVFTLLDLIGGKVSYTHNGEEEFSDSVSIEMLIIGNEDKDIPERLSQKYAFVLPIIVTPVNDPSIIRTLGNGFIKMAKFSTFDINSDILSVVDPDSDLKDIVYTTSCDIQNNRNYFQRKNSPGLKINAFTQEEVQTGIIQFVDKTRRTTRCDVMANDKGDRTNTVTLTFQPIELHIGLLFGSRIRVAASSYIILTNANLNTRTNVPLQKLNVTYKITAQPFLGNLELLQSDQSWIKVTHFNQQNIDDSEIRYRHTNISYRGPRDQFSFIVTCLKEKLAQSTIPVDITPLTITVNSPNSVKADGSKGYFLLTHDKLEAGTNNHEQPPVDIKFLITRPPAQGHLYHVSTNEYSEDMFTDSHILANGDIFTQKDINDGLIVFKLGRKVFDTLTDFIDLRVQVPEAQSKLFRLRFQILPEQTDIKFINSPLTNVFEGGQKAIEKDVLYLETSEYREFEYTVIDFPKHGILVTVHPRSMGILERNISKFTNEDIRTFKIIYQNDDSESATDSFTFIAVPIIQSTNKPTVKEHEFHGTFQIQITMRNDHYPIRLVDKVFHVVVNSDHVLTLDDLAFGDPDIDFNAMNLVYSHRGVSNGDFIFTDNKTAVYRFTQENIADGDISFRNKGTVLIGRAVMHVSDGQFVTTCLFEIQASNRYIKIVNNSGIIVKSGKFNFISSLNLSVETNIDCQPHELKFVLIEEPLYGKVEKNHRDVAEFTYQDVLSQRVSYKHNGRNGFEDAFQFIVMAQNAQIQGTFPIRIITESHNHPPRIINNNLIEVQELREVEITKDYLEVSHPDTLPSGIKYTVESQPQHGRLLLNGHRENIVNHFTQEDINNNNLKFRHTQSGPLDDFFTFDVSNGFKSLRNLQFVMEIVPSFLEIDTKNLTVREGGRVPLTPSHLKLKNRYYNSKLVDYEVLRQPGNGQIETIRNLGTPLASFTSESIQNGEIFYVHDNSEMSKDNFILKAAVDNRKKESRMTVMHVAIKSVNDKPPSVVVNKKLEIWRGSMTLITTNNLKSSDPDSPPENIRYTITQPTNGHVALLNNTFRGIASFTQALVNAGQVTFVHQGADNGEFSFHVSDGVNSDGRLHKFYVTAKSLFVTLVRNVQLKVYPGRTQAITISHLYAKTNDPRQTHPIIYNVMAKPKKGRIITRYNQRPLELQSFKQDDIENGLIFYEHTSFDTEWDETDVFTFEVSSLYASPVQNQRFQIDISYTNIDSRGGASFNEKGKLSVKEGGEVTLTRDHVDVTDYIQRLHTVDRHRVDVSFILAAIPKHGNILLHGNELMLGQSFTQDNINRRQVKYKHDDSETIEDNFMVKLELLDGGKLPNSASLNFTVKVTPVNDELFQLVTTNPRLYVVQGLKVDITSNDLKTEDLDTPSDQIIYELTILPKNGIIAFKDNPRQLINRFSQKDIDDGKLQFQHDGKNPSTTFHFRVSDGTFPAISRSCYITVIPVSIELINEQHIQLMQSDNIVDITSQNVAVKTNGLKNNVYYNITTPPRYGAIYSGKSVVLSFKQTDIDEENIYYKQHDLSSYVDYFIVDVFYPGIVPTAVIHNRQINIGVEPLIVTNPFTARIGEKVAITTKYLDAGKLANITGHMPQFKIIEKPKHGRILGPKRVKRNTDSETHYDDIAYFSHDDIVHGNVFYSVDNIPYQEGLWDSFGYMLSADSVQPAAGRFSIKLAPPDGNSTDVNPKGREVIEPDVRSDFVIVLAILIPLFILLIIVLLVIYFIWRRRHHQEYVPPSNEKRLRPSISGPLTLDQPHVHIEPKQEVTPCSDDEASFFDDHQNYYNLPPLRGRNDEYRLITHADGKSEVGSKVPQCKVTLLADDNESASRMSGYSVKSDTSTELFEWSSLMDPEILQHCRTTNPVLRDNQYWV